MLYEVITSSFEPIASSMQVRKPIFGREGGSVSILDENGNIIEEMSGEYDSHKMLYSYNFV